MIIIDNQKLDSALAAEQGSGKIWKQGLQILFCFINVKDTIMVKYVCYLDPLRYFFFNFLFDFVA